MRPYEDALLLHREIMDMGTRELMERIGLDMFVSRHGESIVRDPSPRNPAMTVMLRVISDVEPRLSDPEIVGTQEFFEILAAEAKILLDNPGAYAKRITRHATKVLENSVSVWASPEVVERASATPPTEVLIPRRESLPFEQAFVVLAEPVDTHGTQIEGIEAVSWHVLNDQRILFHTYSRVREDNSLSADLGGRLVSDLSGIQQFGEPMVIGEESLGDFYVKDSDKQGALAARIMALLARQPEDESATDVRVAVADSRTKEAKRTAKKAGIKPEVNVIYVTEEKTRALGNGTGSKVSRHRVRGHWRHQAYGPKRSLRRWVFIEEHERGHGEADERDRVYVER